MQPRFWNTNDKQKKMKEQTNISHREITKQIKQRSKQTYKTKH